MESSEADAQPQRPKGRRPVRLLGVAIIILELAIFIISAASIYTILSTFTGSLMSEEQGAGSPIGMENQTDSLTGAQILNVKFNAKNNGPLEVLVKFRLRILTSDGTIVAEGEDAQRIPPDSAKQLVATLTVPKEEWQRFQEGRSDIAKGEFSFEIRSFFDLVGFGLSMEAKALR